MVSTEMPKQNYTLVLKIVAITCFMVTAADAQNVFRPIDTSGGFIEAPRAIRQQLSESERAISEKRYSDAVLGLGKLLQRSNEMGLEEDIAGQDFFLDANEDLDSIAIKSLLRRAEDQLGALPPEGLELYELNYGATARKELDAATTNRDWNGLRDVVRRYFHTKAGYQAAYLWGYHELATGRPLAASVRFGRLATQPNAAKQLGGQLDVALARSLQLANRDPKQITAAMRPVAGQSPATDGSDSQQQRAKEYKIGEAMVPAAEPGNESDWLEAHFAKLQRSSPPIPMDYPVAGGDASRSLNEGGQKPLSSERWLLPTTSGDLETRAIRDAAQAFASQGELPPPSWLPLRVGNQLLMRTTERLMGVDFETGKRTWEYPWESAAAEETSMSVGEEISTDSDQLNQRVWYDLPYGRISSDGKRVFLLEDLGKVQTVQAYPAFGFQPIRQGVSERKNAGSNTLVALDIESEGKLLWRTGVGEEIPSIYTEAFFLGPPLPVNGQLYVLAELEGDIFLLCMDPKTGTPLWRQQILAMEAGGIENDPIRRISGAMPAYQDGVLVCPTSAGAVVAIDLASRSLLWGAKYARSRGITNPRNMNSSVDSNRMMQRWYDGTPQIVDGTVYITPVDSDRLHALDLLTGKPRFPEIQRSDMRYLAGVRDEQIIIVGTREVHAYEVKTGRRRWTTALNESGQNAQVSGLSTFGGNLLFVPMSDRQIITIDLAQGIIAHRQPTNFELGNLLQAGGQLISQSPTEVAVSFGQQWLRPTVEEHLAKNPKDLWAIKRKAQLLIEDGQTEDALEWLATAREIAPKDEEARSLSVTAMLGALRTDFESHVDLLAPLQTLVRMPNRQAEMLALMARGNVQQGHPLKAIEQLIEHSSLLIQESNLLTDAEPIPTTDPYAHPSLDSWIAGQVQKSFEIASAEEAEEMNQAVSLHLETAYSKSTRAFERALHHFSSAAGANAGRLKLVDRLIREDAGLRAERLVKTALLQSDLQPSQESEFRLRLAEIYAQGNFREDVQEQLALLSPDELDEEKQAILANLQSQIQSDKPITWPAHVHTRWNDSQQRIGTPPAPELLEILAQQGAHLQGWQIVTEEGKSLSLRDPQGRITAIPMDHRDNRSQGQRIAVLDGGLMVALMPTELVAVNLFSASQGSRDSVLWRHAWRNELGGRIARHNTFGTPFGDHYKTYEIDDPLRNSPKGEYRLGPIMENNLYVLNAGDLQAIHTISGTRQWSNSGAPRTGHILASPQQIAVASPQSGDNRIDFFSTADGMKVDSKPWPAGEKIWSTAGRNLLTYEETKDAKEIVVRLRDLFEDKIILEESLQGPETAGDKIKGDITDGRWLSILHPEGKVIVWDLVNGSEVLSEEIEPIEKLSGLQAVARGNRLILLPETSMPVERVPNTVPLIAQSENHVRVDGPLIGIDLKAGKIDWNVPLEDGPWGCTIGQATGSPLLIFSRSLMIHSPTRTGPPTRELSLLAVDIQTGETKAKRANLRIRSTGNDVATLLNVDTNEKVVAAMVGASFMQFMYSDDPPPETPEAEAPNADELDEDENFNEPFGIFN